MQPPRQYAARLTAGDAPTRAPAAPDNVMRDVVDEVD